MQACQRGIMRLVFQSTLPARGATISNSCEPTRSAISIHAPRTGSDPRCPYCGAEMSLISIHAPRTGSDNCTSWGCYLQRNFNPRSPHGERRDTGAKNPARCRFQSTLPARGATTATRWMRCWGGISIHAPRTGSDPHKICGVNLRGISIHAPRTGSDQEPQQ